MTEASLSPSAASVSTRQRKHPHNSHLRLEHDLEIRNQHSPESARHKSSPILAAKRRKPLPCTIAISVLLLLLFVSTALVFLVARAKSSTSLPLLTKKDSPRPPTASPIVTFNIESQPTALGSMEEPRKFVGATDDAFSIVNLDTKRDYPLESLGIQSATEFYKKGMRQRSKPFSLADFQVEVTCQSPIQQVPTWKTRAPYVLILGAQKGGTTAMAYYLFNHPQFIYIPSKEFHFFDDDMDTWSDLTNLDGSQILEKYQNESMSKDCTMKEFQEQQATSPAYIMDATPNYLFASDRVPQRVFCACGPWIKLLAFLRNPIDRAWSQYHMQQNTDSAGNLTSLLSFEEYIEMDMKVLKEVGVLPPENAAGHEYYGSAEEQKAWKIYTRLGINSPLGRGLYSIQLRQWLQAMKDIGKPSSHLMVFSSEQMKFHSGIIYQQVLEFLELPPHEMSNFEPVHETKYDENTKMKLETRIMLQDFFRPYNQQLKDLLGSEWEGIWEG